jgi:suppressor of G2 allele of SKP1
MPVKHSWYQTSQSVFIDIFVRNIDPSALVVDHAGSELRVDLVSGSERETITFKLLNVCSLTKYKVYSTKLSIELVKTVACEWKSLETGNLECEHKPLKYPTSAKNPIDFDSIDCDDKTQTNADIQAFFKDIYQQADPDAKRAMMKSLTESGGTVLSTNWSDVGGRKVEKRPPKCE